jgi:hypothetical protein
MQWLTESKADDITGIGHSAVPGITGVKLGSRSDVQ